MIKKGFTLIELLAVIVVLGIICVITVPIGANTVNESKMKAFQDTALGVLNTAKQTYIDYAGSTMRIEMENLEIRIDGQPTSTKLSYSGSVPKNGYVEINADGEATIIIYNQTYCAYKINNKEKVKVIEIDSFNECTKEALEKLEG